MSGPRKNFDELLNAIGCKHAAMTRGYTTETCSDGMIVVKPSYVAAGSVFQLQAS